MTRTHRPRRWLAAAYMAMTTLALAACSAAQYPNTTFEKTSDFNIQIQALMSRLVWWGSAVFIFVEIVLIVTLVKWRHREGSAEPKQVHGNTTLEIAWTAIPALLLVFIAIPTVKTIFITEAKAPAGALQVEVIGHQWWWEFRYPQYHITTANELYLPVGRTANFKLNSADVIHSFWIPRLAGKRDLIANRTNYLWFTPDTSLGTQVFNGSCNEYCGSSHANMRFRVFTVTPAQFDLWVQQQQRPAAITPVVEQPIAPGAMPATKTPVVGTANNTLVGAQVTTTTTTAPNGATVTDGYTYPKDKLPDFASPDTPMPAGLPFDDKLTGDPMRGQQIFSTNACIGCHTISGNPSAVGVIGPNLTHVGSRTTIAGAILPNDPAHMARWIKNSRMIKPGSLMNPMGKGQPNAMAALDDQQIADVVAYLQALK